MDRAEKLRALDVSPVWEWSEDATDLICESIKSDDAAIRELAVGLASEVMDDALCRQLAGIIVSDPSAEVAARAAIALGPALEECDLDGYDIDPDGAPLTEATFDWLKKELEVIYRSANRPTLVRRRVLEASVRASQPWHIDAVRAAHQTADSDWIVTAVFCMGHLHGFDSEILAALDADDPVLKAEAVRAAGQSELQRAGRAVLTLAKTETTPRDLRIAAVDALASLNPDGSQELLEELAASSDGELAQAAQDTLDMRLPDPDMVGWDADEDNPDASH